MPFGPGANMMKEFQRNRNQQQDRKSLKETMDGSSSGQRENNLNRQELSEERRAEVRAEMRRKGRADLIKGLMLVVIIGGALTAFTLYLLS